MMNRFLFAAAAAVLKGQGRKQELSLNGKHDNRSGGAGEAATPNLVGVTADVECWKCLH
jgi:hypothetical protein